MSSKKRGPYSKARPTPNRIRELRLAAGLTQGELARAMGLSPKSGYIGDLETGRQRLPTDHPWRLTALARALGCTEGQLFRWSRPTDKG